MCPPFPYRFVVGHSVLRPETTVKLEVPVDEARYSRITRKVYLAAEIAETWPLLAPLCLWYVEGWTRRLEAEEAVAKAPKGKPQSSYAAQTRLKGATWQGLPFIRWSEATRCAIFGDSEFQMNIPLESLRDAEMAKRYMGPGGRYEP